VRLGDGALDGHKHRPEPERRQQRDEGDGQGAREPADDESPRQTAACTPVHEPVLATRRAPGKAATHLEARFA